MTSAGQHKYFGVSEVAKVREGGMEDVARKINRPTTGHRWTDGDWWPGAPGGRVPQEPLRGSQQGRLWSVQTE